MTCETVMLSALVAMMAVECFRTSCGLLADRSDPKWSVPHARLDAASYLQERVGAGTKPRVKGVRRVGPRGANGQGRDS
jgi:hypothetical protein